MNGFRALGSSIMSPEGAVLNPMVEYMDDFIEGGYNAGASSSKFSATANDCAWLLTLTDGGSDAGEVIAVADDEPGGVLTLTTNDADNDSIELQHNGETWKVAADKDMIFECRVKVADADSTDWFIGLATTDTTVLDGTTERIGFGSNGLDAANASIYTFCEDASTETSDDTGKDLVDDTFVVLSFLVRSNERVKFFVDGEYVAQSTTNIPTGDAVTLTVCVQNDSAAVHTMEVDYIYCAQER